MAGLARSGAPFQYPSRTARMSHASDQSKHPICREDTHVASKLDWRVCSRRRTDGDDRRRAGGGRREYPNWKGQWNAVNPRLGGQAIKFDPTKAWGPAQQAPLTPEYQKVLADSMADQAKGGLGNYPTARCLPSGMPRLMALPVQEYVITPETTYILIGHEIRRIFTDGRDWRDWPKNAEPAYEGYAIGKWIDEDGDGRYDVLEVETRGPFKGPRAYDAT